MKKITLFFAAAALAFGTVACSDDDEDAIRVLTFEDGDFRAEMSRKWSSMIDGSQNNGTLLYSGNPYSWYDENNTFLSSSMLKDDKGKYFFWNGGHAVSNYVENDLSKGDPDHQLSVTAAAGQANGGHNGSRNFCVQNGYKSDYTKLPQLRFGDDVERVIDHMYVKNTTYTMNVYLNGNHYSTPAKDSDSLKIVATGYTKDGKATRSVEFMLAEGRKVVDTWTKFDLSVLGKVLYVEFDIVSTIGNDYGMTVPAYFAFDDVAVRF